MYKRTYAKRLYPHAGIISYLHKSDLYTEVRLVYKRSLPPVENVDVRLIRCGVFHDAGAVNRICRLTPITTGKILERGLTLFCGRSPVRTVVRHQERCR